MGLVYRRRKATHGAHTGARVLVQARVLAARVRVRARVRVGAWLRLEWLVPKGTDPDPRGIAPTVRFCRSFSVRYAHTGA